MFENFRLMRASSQENINKLFENQENKTTSNQIITKNPVRKSSKGRDVAKKRKDLPPQYK